MITGSKKYFTELIAKINSKTEQLSLAREEIALKYIKKEDWLYYALIELGITPETTQHIMRGKTVAVVGSMSPWVECILLAVGAGHVTTIEYNQLTYGDKTEYNISTVSEESFKEFYDTSNQFDFIVSMSSLDHDGLGTSFHISSSFLIITIHFTVSYREIWRSIKP